jgi:hypothetical protein
MFHAYAVVLLFEFQCVCGVGVLPRGFVALFSDYESRGRVMIGLRYLSPCCPTLLLARFVDS